MSTTKRTGSKGTKTPTKNPTVEMVRQLARILDNNSLSELEVESDDLKIRLSRGGGVAPAPHSSLAVLHAPMAMQGAGEQPAVPEKPEPTGHLVTSPFVGTFYRSPNPDSGPFVQTGDRVEKGQALCIVEAMKLMNEIEADQAGLISEVLVENGQPVEYGQPLFRIDD